MIIKLSREGKIALLQALEAGVLDTANVKEINEAVGLIDTVRPKLMTRKEAAKMLRDLMRELGDIEPQPEDHEAEK